MPYNFLGLAVSRSSDASQSNARSSKTNSTSLTALAGCSVTLWHRAFEQFEQVTPIHTSPDTIWIEISPRLCHHRLHSPHQGGSGAMTFERTEVITCLFLFLFFTVYSLQIVYSVQYHTVLISSYFDLLEHAWKVPDSVTLRCSPTLWINQLSAGISALEKEVTLAIQSAIKSVLIAL